MGQPAGKVKVNGRWGLVGAQAGLRTLLKLAFPFSFLRCGEVGGCDLSAD